MNNPKAADPSNKIMDRIEALAAISESSEGLTRRFATPEHRLANDLVAGWMREAGMSVHEDDIGNVIGRYEGKQSGAPAIMLGSHLDTVVMAGKYDGMLGVLSGLACVETLHQEGTRLPMAVEVVGFADEEGVRYQSTYLGSKAIAGKFPPSELERIDADGISMHDALLAFGKDPAKLPAAKRAAKDISAYLEIHIEQGPVLERENLPVGIVTGISGATRLMVKLAGVPGHAGTVPMNLRNDALATAAECIVGIEQICSTEGDLVGTVGRIDALPGASNVIVGTAHFSVDIRASDDKTRTTAVLDTIELINSAAAKRGVSVNIDKVHEENSIACDNSVIRSLSKAVERHGYTARLLPSGAGHDAAVMAGLTPSGMLFVRCAGGISHNPAESITAEDAVVGSRVLLDTVRLLCEKEIEEVLI